MQPLTGVKVLDFSTLLPGPLASLILGEAGAEVIKVERPGTGDAQRTFGTPYAGTTAEFALLNRGKRSVTIDLKSGDALARLMPLIRSAQVLIEQFRPGVMARLGLGYEHLRAQNPGLIYCSLTGYGQTGPKSATAGHDLNYLAESGLLRLAADTSGAPVIPPALIADIVGGAYPLVINILLALRRREATGNGCYLDIAMTDNLFSMATWAQGLTEVSGRPPSPGGEWPTGGSPRYQIYRTADGCYLAAAPLEQKFWDIFCEAIGLEAGFRDDGADPDATRSAVSEVISTRTASEWMSIFDGIDACVSLITDMKSATEGDNFVGRGLFQHRVGTPGSSLNAAAVPVSKQFREPPGVKRFPALGEANRELLSQREE